MVLYFDQFITRSTTLKIALSYLALASSASACYLADEIIRMTLL
jgi:hypothetical protein